uniref:SJCHGC06826 protein n=1 Tax=Schistosoma japonicum TaxID=6182 RepID=Q5DCG7_SCHJA|nr:SJCHGC06826 protein [Schistosoma japonicum]
MIIINNNNNNEYFIFLLILLLSIEFYGINGEVKVTLNYHRINTTTTTTITTAITNHHHNQNDSLINDQYTLHNTSIILSSYNKQWNFHLDMFIIIFLALFSFCANTGLLYLDRCAKSSNTMNNSSFSNNFISFTTTNNTTTNTTTTNNIV